MLHVQHRFSLERACLQYTCTEENESVLVVHICMSMGATKKANPEVPGV
jgi:hypothetical protein